MTQEVLVTISGLHLMAETEPEPGEPIEVVTPAKYYYKNGKHYIIYDEAMEGFSEPVKNKVKVTGDSCLEIRKSGLTTAHMVFENGKSHVTYYETPFGKLHTEMYTRRLEIREAEDRLDIEVDYRLDVNGEPTADCRIIMNIKSKEA